MSELIVSLAAQERVEFIKAYRITRLYYDVSVTQFAVYWNWAKSL